MRRLAEPRVVSLLMLNFVPRIAELRIEPYALLGVFAADRFFLIRLVCKSRVRKLDSVLTGNVKQLHRFAW